MRTDSLGLFWEDKPVKGQRFQRPMPEIPDTGWQRPTSWPNLTNARVISFDVETYDPELKEHGPGWARDKGHLVGLGVGADNDGRWYFPMRHETEPEWNFDPDHVLAWARDQLSGPQPKVGANIIYDVGWLQWEGVTLGGKLYDVQFAEALIDESQRVALDKLGQKYLGEGKRTSVLDQFLTDWFGASHYRKFLYKAPPRLVGPYGESDVDLPLRIIEQQWPIMASQGLLDLFEMECALIPMIVAMRMQGVRVDLDKAEQAREELTAAADRKLLEIKDMVGFEVNVNANDSMAKAFDECGLTYPYTEKGTPSFVKDWLKAHEHPLAKLVTNVRELKKVRTTFVESFILEAHTKGRVHGLLHPLKNDDNGAVSGRFSMSVPNLQQIPSRDPVLGPLCRGMFVPEEGHNGWIKKDYSQIEYRSLAHYATGPGSKQLRGTYNANPKTDYHEHLQATVEQITGLTVKRRPIKNLNFGLLYGMGLAHMLETLNLGKQAGRRLFDSYHEAAPFVKATMQAASDEAQLTGMISTILGRRSRFWLWEPTDWNQRKETFPTSYENAVRWWGWSGIQRAYLHKALNRRLQGTAADIMKMAMLMLWQSGVFDSVGIPLLTVHDELDWSNNGADPEVWRYVDHVMETAITMRVPIVVDTDTGVDWGACG